MRHAFTLLFLLFSFQLFAQNRNQFGMGYNLFLPKSEMKDGFGSAHGVSMEFLHGFKKAPFIKIGIEGQYSVYGSHSQPQQFVFRDGTTTNTTVNFNSQIKSGGIKARFEQPNSKSRFTPYGQVQGGALGMSSTLFVEDPHDEDGCKPLEKRTLVRDATWYAGGGAGVLISLGKKDIKCCKQFIDISASCIGGGTQRYANMGKTYTQNTNPDPKTEPLNVEFINVNTNEVHEHRVADIYEHSVKLWQVQVKYVFRW